MRIPRSIILTKAKEESNELVFFEYGGKVYGIRARRIIELMDEFDRKYLKSSFKRTPSWDVYGRWFWTCNSSRKRTEYIINNR